MLKKCSLLFFLFPMLTWGSQKTNIVHPNTEVPYIPWFTGPLLVPTAVNMELGHPAIEPTLTFFWNYGDYTNTWSVQSENKSFTINPYIDFQFATTRRTGIELQIQSFTTFTNGVSSTSYADTNILLGYQISDDKKSSWVPDCRFLMEFIFPSGKYDTLNPRMNFDDVTGQGAYSIGPNFSFQKLFYFPESFFILHWAFGYFFPISRPKISGLSLYGGGNNTKGSIRPGQFLSAFIGGEYSLSQNWVIAFESEFSYQFASSNFKGSRGYNVDGTEAKVGIGPISEWVFLPEIQYNFNPHSGIFFGGWFSLIGRNSNAFAAAFFSYLYIF